MRSNLIELVSWCWWTWVPGFIRSLVMKMINGSSQTHLNAAVEKFLAQDTDKWTDEVREVAEFLKTYPCQMIPYSFALKQREVNVMRDPSCRMFYVLHCGKRMYFPRTWAANKIKVYYNGLLNEQDIQSPHRYETGLCTVMQGDIVVDAGASEGFFALGVIDTCSKAYLVECDALWSEALRKTFEPWAKKTVILNVWLSDKDSPENGLTTLDTCINDEKVGFLKADIEGSEGQLLRGCRKLMARSENMRLAVCTYHTDNDANDINILLTQAGFATSFSRGFTVWLSDNGITLRRGVLRAVKRLNSGGDIT